MPKRPPRGSGPIDIFDDEIGRAADAVKAATAPAVAPPSAAPSPPASENGSEAPQPSSPKVVSLPPSTEALPQDTPEKASLAPQKRRAKNPTREAPKTETAPQAAPETASPAPEPNVGLKFRVPQSVKSDFQTFIAELSAALGGVSLDDSNIGRPVLELLLLEHRGRILQAAKEHRGELRRPTNRDVVAMAEFDEALGEILREGIASRKRGRAGGGG